MVSSVTSMGRNGLYDWVMQRASAVFLALYTVFMVGLFIFATPESFADWSNLFAQFWMKIFTLLALIAISAHAWVGMWTISTDYLKAAGVRFLFQGVCALFLFVYVVWAIDILWGVSHV